MKIVAVIPTYQAEELIAGCLDSLLKCIPASQIVLIDNASTDNTLELLADYRGLFVCIGKENLGFAKAVNFGICRALEMGADAVLLVNQDLILNPHSLSTMVDLLFSSDDIGIVSPVHYSETGDKLDQKFKNYLCNYTENFIEDAVRFSLKKSYHVTFVNAACWLLKRQVIEVVGGFDPIFFMYGEDKDYCNRLAQNDFATVVAMDAHSTHLRKHAVSKRSWAKQVFWESNFIYSSWVLMLKDSSRSMTRRLIRLFFDVVMRIIQRIQARNILHLMAIPIALIRVLVNLIKINQHTKKGQTKAAFLEESAGYAYERI